MKPIVVIIAAAVLVTACDVKNPSGPQVGTVAGTISSSKGGPLANVLILVASNESAFAESTRSGVDGTWRIGNVPVGTGGVAIDSLSLPPGCASVPPFTYVVQQTGSTTRFTITVAC